MSGVSTTFEERPKRSQSPRVLYGVASDDSSYSPKIQVDGILYRCPFHVRWRNMLQRAYSPRYSERNPTYKGVTFCAEWLTFSVFREWMEGQDWKGKTLDKDLLVQGNKEYGPDTCCFVSSRVNSLLIDTSSRRGKYPEGVSYHKSTKSLRATCQTGGKSVHLGNFKSVREAAAAYSTFKVDLLRTEAGVQSCPKVKGGLLERARFIESEYNNVWEGE